MGPLCRRRAALCRDLGCFQENLVCRATLREHRRSLLVSVLPGRVVGPEALGCLGLMWGQDSQAGRAREQMLAGALWHSQRCLRLQRESQLCVGQQDLGPGLLAEDRETCSQTGRRGGPDRRGQRQLPGCAVKAARRAGAVTKLSL